MTAAPLRFDRLNHFLSQLERLMNMGGLDEAALLEQGSRLLGELVSVDDWLDPALARPDPARYQQHLIYADPADRYSVVSFVWGPGQSTPIHDHTVWGLIGMLRGAEMCQHYARTAQGLWAISGELTRLQPGQVAAVSPRIGDVHKVWNALADQVSISVHVYGANIGKVSRSVYFEDGTQKGFVSGYSASSLARPTHVVGPDDFAFCRMADVRAALLARQEIALLDLREEDPFAQAHPLFAANLPLGRIEVDTWRRIPRLNTPLVLLDDGEGLALRGARILRRLGYADIRLLEGGLKGWAADGGEIFKDVNVPSKAFGELVESVRHTPSLAAPELQTLISEGADMVILDARRFDEYQTMCIPGGVSVPGAELVLRARTLAPDSSTRIVVNCAGRTRSIIGTQSLINAGVPNPVCALRNGTIGWTLAGQRLEHGASRQFKAVPESLRAEAAKSAQALALRSGARQIGQEAWLALRSESGRNTYLIDVRTPQEFEDGHLPGALNVPGGQLVQETDHVVPVRGARIVLYDNDGVRAHMSASWLCQMGWEVDVLHPVAPHQLSERGAAPRALPLPLAPVQELTAAELCALLQTDHENVRVIDLGSSTRFVKAHIVGAQWVLRSRLDVDTQALQLDRARRIVLTCDDGQACRFAVAELASLLPADVMINCLSGGMTAWLDAGYALESGAQGVISPRIDRYKRPYEGTENARAAMQAYLDWEFGLVEQLGRDGTHGFKVL